MHKSVRQYLIFTFAIMTICWGTCVMLSSYGVYLSDNIFLYIPYILGGLSPTIASYIVDKQNGNVLSIKEWLISVFDFKHNIFSYILPLMLAGIFFICLCSISGYESGAPVIALVFMIPAMLLGGGMEETGWRGILQPELEKKCGYTVATILVAVIWWLWHLPLFFIVGVSQYGADFVAFGINVIGLSFALSAIKKLTSSTFLCILFHCVINSLHGVYIVSENVWGNIAAAFAIVILSYLFLWCQKKKQIFV